MDSLDQIQQAVSELSMADYQALSTWLKEHDNNRWDKQIADDADAGRLDFLFDEARRENQDGTTRPL